MKKRKLLIMMGTLALSMGLLAGCMDNDESHSRSRGRLESAKDDDDDDKGSNTDANPKDDDDDGKGANPDVKPEDEDTSEYGFASADEAIEVFWRGMANCSEEDIKACFLGEEVLSSNRYKIIEEVVSQMMQQAEQVHDTTTVAVENISIQKDSVEPEDLPSNISKIIDVQNAIRATVEVPMTQTVDGKVFDLNDKYEMYVIQVDERWYLDTQINDLGVSILGADGNVAISPEDMEWCQITSGSDSIQCLYTNGVSDSFAIAENVTFGDLCDAFEKQSADFERETFRRVFSLNFGNPASFAELKTMDEAYQASVLASLAEMAHRIDEVDGTPVKMELMAIFPNVYVYMIDSKDYGKCELHMDSQTGNYDFIRMSTADLSQGTITDEDVAGWEAVALLVLNGERL